MLNGSVSPHIRNASSTATVMRDVAIALIPPLAVGVFVFGLRALVLILVSAATCMLTESTLSYLGFGIPLPTPTWGNLLTGANNSIVIQQYWWRWVFPAAIFGICTIAINLIGDGLRDAVDPKAEER